MGVCGIPVKSIVYIYRDKKEVGLSCFRPSSSPLCPRSCITCVILYGYKVPLCTDSHNSRGGQLLSHFRDKDIVLDCTLKCDLIYEPPFTWKTAFKTQGFLCSKMCSPFLFLAIVKSKQVCLVSNFSSPPNLGGLHPAYQTLDPTSLS